MIDAIRSVTPLGPSASPAAELSASLVAIALRGLEALHFAPGSEMPFTLRGVATEDGPLIEAQGRSLRYTAITALGLGRHPRDRQHEVFGGADAARVAETCLALAAGSTDPGALALSLWAAGEVAGVTDETIATRLLEAVRGYAIPTVDCSWAAIAGLAMPSSRLAQSLAEESVARLLAYQGRQGIFPHTLPRPRGVRGHVGSFADQIYPVQAMARFARRSGDPSVLAAADTTARRLVELQGTAGQWWWHYDTRTGDVVEGYPVYSVHQHGMAPMVLAELAEAGGVDHKDAVVRGLEWLVTHPECVEPLVAGSLGVVWRKVGRREPPKAARLLAAVGTSVRPGSRVPGLDRVFPPGVVDYECRPYELGWLLYAWPHTRGMGAAK